MVKVRDWKKDGDTVGVHFLRKEGNVIIFEKDGFMFKVCRSNWPPMKLSPSQCFTPTEYFKHQVEQIHGNLYDLSNVEFTGADNNVDVICEKHGKFSIAAKHLKAGRGCPFCGNESGGNKNRSDTDTFILKARKIHGDVYDYSIVDYESADKYVDIICKIHGIFKITPTGHLANKGCRKCGYARSADLRKLSQNEVITRFHEKHGDRYDYSSVEYKGDAHSQLSIICREHGVFRQSYANHNSGENCPTCARETSPRFKSGFIDLAKLNKNACVYLIKCDNEKETFFKIGITTKEISKRFSGITSMPYNYQLLHKYHSDGESIWNLETYLHKYYKDVKYIPLIPFGGMYECFSNIDIDEYIITLNTMVENQQRN